MNNFLSNSKLFSIIRISLTFIAFSYLAFIDFLGLYMYSSRTTPDMEIKMIIILIAFLIGIIIRFMRTNKLTLVLIIIADLILIWFSLGEVFVDSVWTSLKNIVLEPAVTAIILAIALLTLDWRKRYKTL